MVVWSKYAKQDIKNYINYSKKYSIDKIKKYISDLVLYTNDLQTSPLLGKDFIHIKNIQIRQLVYKMHRIFYFNQDSNIIVIMVAHTSRDLTNIIKRFNQIFE